MNGDSPLPRRLGRYELLLRIGAGGVGSVYLARTEGAGGIVREAAVKCTHPHLHEDRDFVEWLLREARIVSGIRHPNVVPVLDVGTDGEGAYLAMDYVEGAVLAQLFRRERAAGGRIPLPIALRVLRDALLGLHAAHEVRDVSGAPLGLVHRDFSPQSILIGVDGVARITDFGIAKVAPGGDAKSGVMNGKLGYMSPEQVRSPRDIDRRADVWAAGVVAWELVSGRDLHPREKEGTTPLRLLTETPARLRTARADVPPAIDEAVARALTMDPDERIPTAEELRGLLAEAAVQGTRIAEPAEVGEYVMHAVGDTLRDRRRKLEAVLATRSDREGTGSVSVSVSVDTTRTKAPSGGKRSGGSRGSPSVALWKPVALASAGLVVAVALAFDPRPQSGVDWNKAAAASTASAASLPDEPHDSAASSEAPPSSAAPVPSASQSPPAADSPSATPASSLSRPHGPLRHAPRSASPRSAAGRPTPVDNGR